jgi:hypothetical protein
VAKKKRPSSRSPRPAKKSARKPPAKKPPESKAKPRDLIDLIEGGVKIIEGMVCKPARYPERFNEQRLTQEMKLRLVGKAAAGGTLPPSTAGPPRKVIWVDAGDEVLVHLDSMQVRLLDRTIVMSIDLETDQTGRTPLVCVYATGGPDDPAGLVATTDELPRGNALLAGRWGAAVQAACWSALLGLVTDHAKERGLEPLGISASRGALRLVAGKPPALAPGQPGISTTRK